MSTLELDPETQQLIRSGLTQALAVGIPASDILVIVAEPGIVAEMLAVLLPDSVVGTNPTTEQTVAILTGSARRAFLSVWPEAAEVLAELPDDRIPVATVNRNNVVSLTAYPLIRPRGLH